MKGQQKVHTKVELVDPESSSSSASKQLVLAQQDASVIVALQPAKRKSRSGRSGWAVTRKKAENKAVMNAMAKFEARVFPRECFAFGAGWRTAIYAATQSMRRQGLSPECQLIRRLEPFFSAPVEALYAKARQLESG